MLPEHFLLPIGAIIQDRNGESYIVEEIVGKGGFSAVYLVRGERSKQKTFALKEIINPNSHERSQVTFEADLLKRLKHPSLPHVYQVFENSKHNRLYMLMDYIDGKNLETLRKEQFEQRFSLALTLTLLAPIIDAIIYLHNQEIPIVHRDIKPSNIIIPIRMGDAVLVDFGLAKEFIQEKTTNAFRYGTPGYAALEQYGQGTNLRTDIYALGATFYTLLTGTIPVNALTRTVDEHVGDPLPLAHEVNPDIPPRISHIIAKAMSLRSEKRYGSVEHFWQTISIAAIEAETGPASSGDSTPSLYSGSLPQLSQHDKEILATSRVQPVVTTRPQPIRDENPPSVYDGPISQPSSVKPGRWNTKILIALVAFILIGVAADGIFFITTTHRAQSVGNVPVPKASITSTPARATVSLNPYPTLATGYEGTIYDSGVGGANRAEPMYLNTIQQQQDTITGSFRGLGLTLPFSGKVTKDQKITFKVFIEQTSVTLTFNGNIKVGGDIAGSFQSKGPDGQDVQEFGPWNVRQAMALQPLYQAR
ncbi:MAG: serine/threonine protein kinase [Ktedonobacteraceae bacterium]|nr:serine/threonine protein kinase [Ktedonobacteraceae bacterium]